MQRIHNRLQEPRDHRVRLVLRKLHGGCHLVHEICLCHDISPLGGGHYTTPDHGREVSQLKHTYVPCDCQVNSPISCSTPSSYTHSGSSRIIFAGQTSKNSY